MMGIQAQIICVSSQLRADSFQSAPQTTHCHLRCFSVLDKAIFLSSGWYSWPNYGILLCFIINKKPLLFK